MTRFSKPFICLFFIILLVLLSGCSNNKNKINYETKMVSLAQPKSGNNDVDFVFDTFSASFSITDTRNNKKWESGLTDEYYGKKIENELQKKEKNALFSMTYSDKDGNIFASRNTDESMETSFSVDGKKVVADSYVSEAEISFKVIFEIKSNTLIVSVPADNIKENNKDYSLITIEILPFFASSVSSEDGYIFYPDGSGTLYEFKDRNESASATPYKRQVYGDFFCDYDEYINDSESGVKNLMLPVFGVKQGNAAVLTTITCGEADSIITLYPFGYVYDVARITATFNYRYLYEMQTVSGQSVLFPEEKRSKSDFQLQYTFLNGDDANYSGMARAYRDFLLDNGLLNTSNKKTTVSLDYLISLQKPELLWSVNVSASSFSNAENMLKNLSKNKINDVQVNLLGWQSDGYNVYPSHFPVSKSSGGSNGLKSLVKKAKPLSASISLKDNFILAQSIQENNYSKNDLAFNLQNEAYVDNDGNNYLIDFRSAKQIFEDKWIKKAKDNNVNSICLDDIARTFYANGKKSNYLRRSETTTVIKKMIESAKNNFESVTISGGNLYGLKYADFLSDIPESSSQDFLFDRDVPFFQIVVHGNVSYSPEIPGNFSNDYEETLLKWAEYAFIPYFSVSESSATALKDCYSDGVVVSKYQDVSETIINTVKRFNESFASLKKQTIYSHEILDSGLTEVTYSNGVKVIVNYSDKNVNYGDKIIDARDYLIIR